VGRRAFGRWVLVREAHQPLGYRVRGLQEWRGVRDSNPIESTSVEPDRALSSDADPVESRGYAALPETATSVERGSAASRCSSVAAAVDSLAVPTPDLFIAAGAIAAERAARGGAMRFRIEEILRRAVDQASTLREHGRPCAA
jgi:hypothetical protein